jgi:hypothetical protein
MVVVEAPKVVMVEESVMSVLPPPQASPELFAETDTSKTETKKVQVTLTTTTGGQNPSSMLLTGKWEVLPRRKSPEYSLQDALATMDIDIHLMDADVDADADADDAMN